MNDFHDWKLHPITIVLFDELTKRIEFYIDKMVEQASTASQVELAEWAGAIKNMRDIVNIAAEDLKQETDE